MKNLTLNDMRSMKTPLARFVNRFGGVKLFAEALGVTPGAVYHWLCGRRHPTVENVRAIMRLSRNELTFDDLLP